MINNPNLPVQVAHPLRSDLPHGLVCGDVEQLLTKDELVERKGDHHFDRRRATAANEVAVGSFRTRVQHGATAAGHFIFWF